MPLNAIRIIVYVIQRESVPYGDYVRFPYKSFDYSIMFFLCLVLILHIIYHHTEDTLSFTHILTIHDFINAHINNNFTESYQCCVFGLSVYI